MENEIIQFDDDIDTIWLTQRQLANIFGVSSQNITQHIKNIYLRAELDEISTCKPTLQVQCEGGRNITREVKIYNFDIITSLSLKINTGRSIQLRLWLNDILKLYLNGKSRIK